MLNAYLTQTKRLLQNPPAPNSLYNSGDLTDYINEARVQLAGESMSIRVLGTLTMTAGDQGPYAYTSIDISSSQGVAGVLDVRSFSYVAGDGQVWMAPRSFEWFTIYNLNTGNPVVGVPSEWAQYGQGVNATMFVSPPPDIQYVLIGDCVCYPIALTNDMTIEAIPPLWTTAVPYYAAYLALLSAQTGIRTEQAKGMLDLYELFTARARKFTTPETLPLQYSQTIPQPQAAQYGGGKAA
jgi:hypothetical protein